eukprot:CAMPEP_0202713670 /NCGR_PEP_ID=MMETSP1385-20130828/57682_1 /ASSEMBLY_ACC=CAM_ASM_000861 /TAXON_ID=933848 /ORGANISM="Elphidium margaritaceum" /LENGTH=434 /DNA_ID=CAMNT_0049374095 /DNA_START=33 /DNA_END=1337 /DNA_ORIENTATION=-
MSNNNNHLFTDEHFPVMVLNNIWSYLIDEAPLADSLVLTCRSFRALTYNHPSHASRFHFRLQPHFTLNQLATNHNKFQIGADLTPATKRAIIVCNVEDAITNNPHRVFPFHSLKVFNVTQSCTLKHVIPFFREFKHSIKFMSWNNCKFLFEDLNKMKSDDGKEAPKELIQGELTECTLFSFLTRKRWHERINLNGKFPKLLCFSYTIEWFDHFDLIQAFLDSHAQSMGILFLDFNFNLPPAVRNIWESQREQQSQKRLRLKLPPNVEICVLSCLNAETAKFMEIDFSACRHKLKQLVCLVNSVALCHDMFLDGKGNENLEFLVINDIAGVHAIKWDALQIGSGKLNKLQNIYLPCTPEWANKISANCIGEFPDLEQVKDCLENVEARKVLRDLNCEQRRHWLWGMFWFERHGIGMKKLKRLEEKWKQQASVHYF